MAAPHTKPMYRLKIFDFDGKILLEEQISMQDIVGRLREAMPQEIQTISTVHNHLTSKGYYVRAGEDVMGLHVVAIVSHLPK